ILSDIYVRWLPPAYDFLIVAILATLGALVRARLADVLTTRIPIPFTEPRKTFSIPALLFVVDALYLMTCFLFYKFELIYILKTYHLFTPFVAYWLTGKMRRRVALTPDFGGKCGSLRSFSRFWFQLSHFRLWPKHARRFPFQLVRPPRLSKESCRSIRPTPESKFPAEPRPEPRVPRASVVFCFTQAMSSKHMRQR